MKGMHDIRNGYFHHFQYLYIFSILCYQLVRKAWVYLRNLKTQTRLDT